MIPPSGTISIQRLAEVLVSEGIDTGEKRLYAWLRKNDYLDGGNVAKMRHVHAGLFKVKNGLYERYGEPCAYVRTFVTSKGISEIKSKMQVKHNKGKYQYSGMGLLEEI